MKVFKQYLDDGQVELRTGAGVTAILTGNGRVTGVETSEGSIQASAVILAAGGSAHPVTGSNGEGCQLAAGVGHTIIPLRPALVPLRVAQTELAKSMQAVSL